MSTNYCEKAYLINDIKKDWEEIKENELFLRTLALALQVVFIDDLVELVNLMDNFYYHGMVDGKPVSDTYAFVVYLNKNY
jgi:hypothetical protein